MLMGVRWTEGVAIQGSKMAQAGEIGISPA